MRVGAILLLCLVLQLSFAGSKKSGPKQRPNVLHKAVHKHVNSRSLNSQKKATTQHASEVPKHLSAPAARRNDIDHKEDRKESKVLKRSVKDTAMHHEASLLPIHMVEKRHEPYKKAFDKRSLNKPIETLYLSKRSSINANEGFATDIGKTRGSEILEEKLPGGYGEEAMSETDEEEGSGSEDDSGDDESGSGTTETPSEYSKGKINEKSVDRDEDDVTQIVQSELREEASRGSSFGASTAEAVTAGNSKPVVQGKGSKRQPKGDWVCRKRCASPMSYEECANPRCSYKIGTIKDLCYFLCKNQQTVCKEVCKYE